MFVDVFVTQVSRWESVSYGAASSSGNTVSMEWLEISNKKEAWEDQILRFNKIVKDEFGKNSSCCGIIVFVVNFDVLSIFVSHNYNTVKHVWK